MRAIALLQGRGIRGMVTFHQQGKDAVVQCDLDGVPDGAHGLHVHEFGDQTEGCASMGEHFSLQPRRHGGRTGPRHTGDLGNVVSKGGTVHQRFLVRLPVAQILGRGLVLHAQRDDLGRGDWPDSGTTGHSGARIACGVVALAQ